MVLKEFQDPLVLPCDGRIEQKWRNMQGIWPIWLPTVGHTLATTHVYNLKYTSLRLLMVFLCVSTVLCLILDSPEPWLNQLYARRSCLAAPTLLGNDATCEHWKMAFLFSFSLTGLSLLMPREEQVQRCHHVSYTNKSNAILVIAWHDGKPFIAVLVLYNLQCKCCASARGAPYI